MTPKSRAEISIGHNDPGVLSTVMKFDASEEPKKKAFQNCVPARTAAESDAFAQTGRGQIDQIQRRRHGQEHQQHRPGPA